MGVSFFGGDSLCFPFETHLKTGVPTLTKTNVNGLSVLDPVHLPKMEVDLPHASGRITPNSPALLPLFHRGYMSSVLFEGCVEGLGLFMSFCRRKVWSVLHFVGLAPPPNCPPR